MNVFLVKDMTICFDVLQMSDIVGFDIRPQEDTSLHSMLEYGLNKHLAK